MIWNKVSKVGKVPRVSKAFGTFDTFNTFDTFRKGYTLIEILVSLTIIGLLFAFGYVSFREYSRRQALADGVRKVQAGLRSAQELALSGQKPEGTTCTVLNGFRFTLSSSSNPPYYAIKAACKEGDKSIGKDTVYLPAGITYSSASILFKVLGQGTDISSGGQVTIRLTQVGTGNPQTIIVEAGGNIEIE